MLVHAHGFAVSHAVAGHVHVELDVRGGLPGFAVIGLDGGAARDARERVQAAVLNSGFAFPRKRVTANLAPAVSARGARALDLVLACCVLASQGELDHARLARIGLFAELGLGGDLRPCEGVSATAEAAADCGLAGLVVARADLQQARDARALPVAGLSSLGVVAALLRARPSASGRGRQAAAAGNGRGGHESSRAGTPGANPKGRERASVPAASANGAQRP